jgi:Lon protease-like protein
MSKRIRLFLLNTVLFPRMELPLHVFEERYKQLVAECLADDQPFGVLLIREGAEVGDRDAETYEVGCTTRIENAAPTEGGRLMILTRGERRFRILETDEAEPYRSATVEYPVDELSEVPEALFERASEGYRQIAKLRAMTEGVFQRDPPVSTAPGVLADRIGAAAAGMVPPSDLQRLLECFDVRERLEAAVDLLDAIVEGHHEQARMAIARRYGGVERLN